LKASAVRRRAAFTLIEMTIVIMVIAILAALALPVVNSAYQQSRTHRTRAIIAKIDQIIMEKYDGYRTRQVPIRIAPQTRPDLAAGRRLLALHELMRFELPDRITDVASGPAYGGIIPSMSYGSLPLAALYSRPAINKQFLRYASRAHAPAGSPAAYGIDQWTTQNENAECLYLILAVTRDGDKAALDWFSPTEIGDTDDDGMKEILDSWGQPIAFLRWAPGYRSEISPFVITPQKRNDSGLAADPTDYPDPFDPFHVDPRWNDADLTNDPIALKPLIWSSGADKKHDINVSNVIYSATVPANDPFYNGGVLVGTPMDSNADSSLDYQDNITNHDLEAR
jgi:prepilin-type N-terminal cleavage/methylation domain-containing protein